MQQQSRKMSIHVDACSVHLLKVPADISVDGSSVANCDLHYSILHIASISLTFRHQ